MATIRFGEEDRDERGFIRLSPPTPTEAPIDVEQAASPAPRARPAEAVRPSLSPRLRYQLTIAAAAVAGLLLVLASIRFGGQRAVLGTNVTPPTVAATTAAPPSAVPATAAPDPTVAAYFNYRDPQTSTTITITGMLRVEGTAGDNWRLIALSNHRTSVWVSAADVPSGLAIADPLPDLAPKPTPRPPPATATPEPPPCASAGVPGKMVTVCGWGDLSVLQDRARQQWIEQYGGNVGIVTTPTPPEWSKP